MPCIAPTLKTVLIAAWPACHSCYSGNSVHTIAILGIAYAGYEIGQRIMNVGVQSRQGVVSESRWNSLHQTSEFKKSGRLEKPERPKECVAFEKGNSFLRVSVIDQGPGIEKQVSAKLFQKFFQTSEGKSAGGTGLGLAIAKLIVESHGGIIGVDSTVGEGSTFWFELPLRGSSDPG